MNILLLGYGKMGHTIEEIAVSRGHKISGRITSENQNSLTKDVWDDTDVVIEFSSPEAAASNIQLCLENNKPVLSGTTGWLSKKPAIEELCNKLNGTFFYASNYSIGVNIFFRINRYLAQIMEHNPEYDVSMKEIHHTAKKDSPSGTAISLAEGIINEVKRKNSWTEDEHAGSDQLKIYSEREGEVPGTHIVRYNSEIDTIEIKHEAHSRKGFAMGAVLVAEWLKDKKGVLSMDDFLSF
ncbi:MAG: 4-hydroxy-tetrahydrodipicolinate reductase [Candidatus Cyclobacteriaceae bacterium M2_1C_046]